MPKAYRFPFAQPPSSPMCAATTGAAEMPMRVSRPPNTPMPEVQLLSNGRYHVMVTNAGGGYSRWKDLAVTRWREDSTRDNWGTFCYLRDVASGEFWSTTYQPTLKAGQALRGDLLRRARRVPPPRPRISTRTPRSRSRRKTTSSCAALRITNRARDAPHDRGHQLRRGGARAARGRRACIRRSATCSCRRRSCLTAQRDPVHAPAALAERAGAMDVPPDGSARHRYRSKSRTKPTAWRSSAAARPLPHPQAHDRCRRRFPDSDGSVLDPIVAIRAAHDPRAGRVGDDRHGHRLGETAAMPALTGREIPRPAPGRPRVRAGLDAQPGGAAPAQRHRSRRAAVRAPGQLGHLRQCLRCAPTPPCCSKNRRGQSGLWGYAISGDLPIVLLQISDAANIELVRQLVQAHAYWRAEGTGGRPGDLERGSRRLPPGAAGPDHGPDRRQRRSPCARPPGGIFVRPRASRCRPRTASCCRRWRA